MVFSSTIFLFLFLPLVLFFYFIVPGKFKNYVLLLFSIIFYLFGGINYFLLLFLIVLLNYIGGLLLERTSKRKLVLIVTIGLNILSLVYFKYMGFIILNLNEILNLNIKIKDIILPIGISFYTFQAMSYTIDAYRKKIEIQKNFFTLFLYVSLFPQLVAGPIVRYETIEKELKNRRTTFDDFEWGLRRFILGLSKKVIIANQMGKLSDIIFSSPDLSTPTAWIGAISYTFQIYYDFSAYSDMAIGLGRIFGFRFLENFNFPYISKSVTEFWRRWHISLSSWFRDYIYIPLGGNRKGVKRQILNLFIVWSLTGLWHGAKWNFILWGLYYFVFLMIEKFLLKDILKKTPNVIKHIYTLLVIIFGWVLFRCESFDSIMLVFGKMLSFDITTLSINESLIYLETYFVYFILAVLFSGPTYYVIVNKIEKMKEGKAKKVLTFVHYMGLILLFIVTIMFLAYSSYNPFIYFRF